MISYLLMSLLCQLTHPVFIYRLGGGITKDLRDFLSQDFPNTSEVDLYLQDETRENLYARTVPCKLTKLVGFYLGISFP